MPIRRTSSTGCAKNAQWAGFSDGIHSVSGDEHGEPYSYKLAVRKTPDAWFFLAYDMTDSVRGGKQLNRALVLSVLVFSLLSLVLGWWSASKVMKPVSDRAARLRAYRVVPVTLSRWRRVSR